LRQAGRKLPSQARSNIGSSTSRTRFDILGNSGKAKLFPISAFLATSDNLWLTTSMVNNKGE
jgi:hypothetical protein